MQQSSILNFRYFLFLFLAVFALSFQAHAMFKLPPKAKTMKAAAASPERVAVVHAEEPYEVSSKQEQQSFSTSYQKAKYASSGDPSFGLISIIAGVVSVVAALFSAPVGLAFGAVAIVFGALGLKGRDRTLAIIGLCLGIAIVIVCLIAL